MLGLIGIEFSLSDVKYILEHTSPFLLKMSRFSIDEPILRSLESEFDTSITVGSHRTKWPVFVMLMLANTVFLKFEYCAE